MLLGDGVDMFPSWFPGDEKLVMTSMRGGELRLLTGRRFAYVGASAAALVLMWDDGIEAWSITTNRGVGQNKSPTSVPGFVCVVRERYLISICRGFAAATFGRLTLSTPFSKLAVTLSASTPRGSVNERWNRP